MTLLVEKSFLKISSAILSVPQSNVGTIIPSFTKIKFAYDATPFTSGNGISTNSSFHFFRYSRFF